MTHNEQTDSHIHTSDGDVVFHKDLYSKNLERTLTQEEFEAKINAINQEVE